VPRALVIMQSTDGPAAWRFFRAMSQDGLASGQCDLHRSQQPTV